MYNQNQLVHWSEIKINSQVGEDIKLSWDLSRYHWLQILARAFKLTNKNKYIDLINKNFEDWNENNLPNTGLNWVCAQECSIRAIHILNATVIASNAEFNESVLTEFLTAHASRIEPTIGYAISQDNNHATSEAAALYIVGAWLLS